VATTLSDKCNPPRRHKGAFHEYSSLSINSGPLRADHIAYGTRSGVRRSEQFVLTQLADADDNVGTRTQNRWR